MEDWSLGKLMRQSQKSETGMQGNQKSASEAVVKQADAESANSYVQRP